MVYLFSKFGVDSKKVNSISLALWKKSPQPPQKTTPPGMQKKQQPVNPWQKLVSYPMASIYGIFTYIYHTNQPNVGKYTIHGWYG